MYNASVEPSPAHSCPRAHLRLFRLIIEPLEERCPRRVHAAAILLPRLVQSFNVRGARTIERGVQHTRERNGAGLGWLAVNSGSSAGSSGRGRWRRRAGSGTSTSESSPEATATATAGRPAAIGATQVRSHRELTSTRALPKEEEEEEKGKNIKKSCFCLLPLRPESLPAASELPCSALLCSALPSPLPGAGLAAKKRRNPRNEQRMRGNEIHRITVTTIKLRVMSLFLLLSQLCSSPSLSLSLSLSPPPRGDTVVARQRKAQREKKKRKKKEEEEEEDDEEEKKRENIFSIV